MAKATKQTKPKILTVTRQTWAFNPRTRVKQNKKGKGSYRRQAMKVVDLG